MASGAPGPANLNSSYANASRALSSKVAQKGFALRAESASERTVTARPNSQIDPAVLARIALEEELKKKGGGGGGARSFNPMTWIPYSFKLLAKAIEQARAAVANAALQALASLTQGIRGNIAQVFQNVGRALQPVNKFFSLITVGFARATARAIGEFARNPIGASIRMANNAMQTGMAIFAAVVNGLKKVIYGKDENKLDPDEEIYKEEGIFSKLINFFTLKDEDNESNGRNIKSHLNNRAKQVTQRKLKKDYITQNA